ncbi:MAG: DUF4922 domain-containing protein [Bacteroidota bacterium]
MSTQQKVDALFEEQLAGWPLLRANRDQLGDARVKQFGFRDFSIRAQFNPRRITSSAAKVDQDSIRMRPCFLCTENRPPEEKGVVFGPDYEILCNPFPIFQKHYTIARTVHTPQVIEPEFSRFLDLCRELPSLVVLYNGPSCGASAPDHMHFQAGTRGFMPIEDEMGALKKIYGSCIPGPDGFSFTAVSDGLRRFYLLESDSADRLTEAFMFISAFMRKLAGGQEPMLNIVAWYDSGWKVLVFPRGKHRPWQYFEEGTKNILISPASVDLGGTMILPMEKDFNKLCREDIEDIFAQISLPEVQFNALNLLLKKRFGR